MSNQKRFALIGRGFGSSQFDEAVQDAVGGVLTDSSEINFTYTDATPSITATLINAGVTFARLQNFDALSVLGRAANSSGVSDEIAAGANDRLLRRTSDTLNFGQLTAGMFPNTVVPDAALSSNVPLLNAANVFTNAFEVNSFAARFWFVESDATADEGVWSFLANVDTFTWSAYNDARNAATDFLTISRTGITVDEIEFNATTLDFNGTLDIDGGNHDISTTGTFTISGTGETLATFVDDGAVTLYYDNAARIATSATGVTITGASRTSGYTVATLPAGTQGDRAFVTDATAPTFLATLVGGGAVVCPAFYDGTNWVAG